MIISLSPGIDQCWSAMSFILYSFPYLLPCIGHNKDAGGNQREITGGTAILLGRWQTAQLSPLASYRQVLCVFTSQSPNRAGHTHPFGQVAYLLDLVLWVRRRGKAKGLRSLHEWLAKTRTIRKESCWRAAGVFKDEGVLSVYHVARVLCMPSYLISNTAQRVAGSFFPVHQMRK